MLNPIEKYKVAFFTPELGLDSLNCACPWGPNVWTMMGEITPPNKVNIFLGDLLNFTLVTLTSDLFLMMTFTHDCDLQT